MISDDWIPSDRLMSRMALLRALLKALEAQLDQDAEDLRTRRQIA